MVAVPSVLPLETRYADRSALRLADPVSDRLCRSAQNGRRAPPVCRVGPPKAAGPKELRRHDETVPESVPVDVGISAKYWSEWQDLNLRPPRPERGVLPRTRLTAGMVGGYRDGPLSDIAHPDLVHVAPACERLGDDRELAPAQIQFGAPRAFSRRPAGPCRDGGVVRSCYGVMELGSIRARAIAKTPNSVSATSPKFQRVRRVDSIEVVRRLMEGDSVCPAPGAQVLRDSSECKANGEPPRIVEARAAATY
jgi:hypothetical protein